MALFKVFSGNSVNLPEAITPGWCYFTIDEQLFYVDYVDSEGTYRRDGLNAEMANGLRIGQDIKAIVETTLTDSEDKIPTSHAILNHLATIETDISSLETHIHSVTFEPEGEVTSSFSGELTTLSREYTPTGTISSHSHGIVADANVVDNRMTVAFSSEEAQLTFTGDQETISFTYTPKGTVTSTFKGKENTVPVSTPITE